MNIQLPIKSSITNENVARYVIEKIVTDSVLEKQLRLETFKLPNNRMISSSDVGSLLAILAQSVCSNRAIEVGTYTGYTALKIASVLPNDGLLICCDINAEWADIGRKYWEQAQVSNKIDLRIAPALQTLNTLVADEKENTFDFAFIDADKIAYDSYYEVCLKLIRPGGLIVLDNMLWDGAVADSKYQDETTVAIRTLNKKISSDPRVNSCLMTVGDGLMLVRKK